ncbi:GGDEF domain-containing protein [Blastococcus sp. TML/M2B]|uniref:putative bifunctional diguanylate cyclase/phosphodiesterase n=1 Tax=unclassified Blastococcus TaxID=2619396 RepID=UPI00190D1138|nr:MULTISPECIES: bifunctional diguanylate cyclase/phosphodiesterase [unclassified Blastococcus]MBN1094013.1 GGDEF domain-containing protein [Blastococcus sp. TML/M2B]MBN1095869.1 GGDEF domain-containing protein [Blastococcus sp. TML/C7B]
MPEQDVRATPRPAFRAPSTVAVLGVLLAAPVMLVVLLTQPLAVSLPALAVVFLAMLAAESIHLHVEFRRQAVSVSASELAIVVALVEVGGAWAVIARAVAVAAVLLVQRFPRPQGIYTVAVAVLEVCAAVAVLSVLPVGELTSPGSWISYVVAILVADVLGAVLVAGAIITTQGHPGRSLWASLLIPVFVIGPVAVIVGLAALLLIGVTGWAWLLLAPLLVVLALLYRQFGAVTRRGHSVQRVYDFARRVEQVTPDEAGTRQIVAAVQELLNAERVALWLPPYLDEAPQLVVAAEDDAVWYDGPGDPDDVFRRAVAAAGGPVLITLAHADEEQAAGLARRGVTELLAAPLATAAGEPGYLEVCDRRSTVVSFADSDRSALDSMLTHVNAAIRHQQLLTQIRYDADHDRLTGLPNRQRLAAEIDALLAADPAGGRAGLILAAVGNYLEVTDTLGHAASDELLQVTAGLLREHAPPQALLARMESERFAVLLPGLSLAATERAARRLREAAATRVRVAGLDLEVTLTIGVASAPVHGTESGTLMQRADVALLAAADSGGVASYHPVLDQQSLRRLQLGTEIEQAMADGQISVVFQPIIDAQTSDIVSVETLVRWAHPRYGAISPDDFIHLAEQIGRIGAVTDHVLDLALARCRRWLDQDIALSVAVNLSVHCLTEPDLVARVRGALQRHGVPGELLTLELTEGSVVDDSVRDSTVLADLHDLGLRLSMDDFGTGYSSLSQLRQLPIDEVKIDKSFVLGMSTSQGESFIARSIIELAHNLGLRVVAEGVEDDMTRNLLTEMGCDKLQGFLVSRPLPDDRLENWLLARTGVRTAAPGAAHRRLFVRG